MPIIYAVQECFLHKEGAFPPVFGKTIESYHSQGDADLMATKFTAQLFIGKRSLQAEELRHLWIPSSLLTEYGKSIARPIHSTSLYHYIKRMNNAISKLSKDDRLTFVEKGLTCHLYKAFPVTLR